MPMNEFILWGNGDHEFSLNNPNPKSKRFYYNKKEFSTVDAQQRKIDNVYCKDNCVLIISKGEIYRKGLFNFEIDDFENETFQKIKGDQVDLEKLEEFDNKNNPSGIKDIQFGANHVLILTEDGSVFSWGDNYYGQLGINNQMVPVQKRPQKIIFPDEIRIDKICAYKNNSFAVDIHMNLWGWGKYEFIKLDDARNIFSPLRVFKEEKKVSRLNVMDGRFIIEVESHVKSDDNNPQASGDINQEKGNSQMDIDKIKTVKKDDLKNNKKNNTTTHKPLGQSVFHDNENNLNKSNISKSKLDISQSKVHDTTQKEGDKLIMMKANDAKQQMERDSLCRYYEDFKSFISKIIGIFQSIDETSLRNIQEITFKEGSFLYELEVDKFLSEFKHTMSLDLVKDKAYERNNLKLGEMKIFDSYIEYLLNIFGDELSLDEYNLEEIYKSYMKNLNSYLKDIRKAQTIDSTKKMSDNIKILLDYAMKYKKLTFFIFKLSGHLYLLRSLKFKDILNTYNKIFDDKDPMGMNIETKLTMLKASFSIISKLLLTINDSLSYLNKLKQQIENIGYKDEDTSRELYVYNFLINSIMEIKNLWEILMKMTNQYLTIQLKNENFGYYFKIQEKLFCIQRYVCSIRIIPENINLRKKDSGELLRDYKDKQAPILLNQLDGALLKVDNILATEAKQYNLDNFSRQMNKYYAESIKEIIMQKKINIFMMVSLNFESQSI